MVCRDGGTLPFIYDITIHAISGCKVNIIFRLSNIVCASMCTGKDGCGAYRFMPKNCTLANATELVGHDDSAPNAIVTPIASTITIMMDIDLVPSKFLYCLGTMYYVSFMLNI